VLDAATGIISGLPADSTTAPLHLVLTATNASGTSPEKLLSLAIAPAPATPVITSPLAARSRVGAPFSYQAAASDNATSFAALNVPPGLALDATSGLLTGTPEEAGTFQITLRAGNAAGLGQPATLVLNVAAPATAPFISSAPSATGQVGAAAPFFYQAAATPAPIDGFALAGPLPLGLSFNTSTGVLSGHPVEAGVFLLQLTATGPGGTSAPQSLVLNLAPAENVPVITSPLFAIATVGSPFNYQITAAGTPPFPAAPFPAPFLLEAVGLPPGLAVNPSSGLVQGTPAAAGTFTATLVGTNSAGAGPLRDLTIFVQPAAAAPVVTSVPFAAAQVGTPFSYRITATNTPDRFEVLGGPPWLTVNTATGELAGTPDTAGLLTLRLVAANAAGASHEALLRVSVAPAAGTPAITSPRTAVGAAGRPFLYAITATNAPSAYVAVGLPPGLTLQATTGLINGVPTTSGQFEVTLLARNGSGSSQPVRLIVRIQPNAALVIPSL
jgi:hypothetical protein